MGGCRCSYKNCRSSTKRAENIHFFHYPVKNKERCALWIRNANKPEFINLPDDQLRNKVVCGLHFENKCFINHHKNRLVQDARPTIDGECEEEFEIKAINKVEVLPTSADGSTFTLQTNLLQPLSSGNNEKKFGFHNGKISMHNFGDAVSEVYTIDPSYIQQPFYTNSSNNLFMNSSTETEEIIDEVKEEAYTIIQEPPIDNLINNVMEEEVEYVNTNTEPNGIINNTNSNDSSHLKIIHTHKINGVKNKSRSNKQLLKRVAHNSNEINKIKKCLAQKYIKVSKGHLLKLLKGRVPSSLLGAVSMHLGKKETNLAECEKSFLQTMYSISPSAFNVLKRNGWFIPKQVVIDRKSLQKD